MSATGNAMIRGRAEGSARRRQNVIVTIERAVRDGADLTASAVARRAGVDRSFLYRHRDLLERLHRARASDPPQQGMGAIVSRESLKTDLANAHERSHRLRARVQQLERRLSEALGEQVWRESGLGTVIDIETLQRQIVMLQQANTELTRLLDERDRDLAAARAANRDLIARINSPARTG